VGSCTLKISGIYTQVLVCKNLGIDLLLGMNILRSSIIDNLNGILTLGDQKFPIDTSPESFSTYATTCIPKVDDETLNALLRSYKDVFSAKENPVGVARDAPLATIDTGDAAPIKQNPYRMPLSKRKIVEEHVESMLADGVIIPSDSPWASPITLAPKKDGTIRFCVDFRKVNDVTKKDAHPLPHIQDIFDQLHGAKIFSTLDLRSGYWQIPLHPDSIPKASFSCHLGLFSFTVLPYGVSNGPAIFQRTMNKVLSGLIGRCCMAYIDDIIVYSRSKVEHVQHLEQVFQRLRSSGFLLKPSKCSFMKEEVELLGYIVSGSGIRPQPGKIEAIQKLAPPTDKTGVRSFKGMCGYYRQCIPNFAQIAAPLEEVAAPKKPFFWGPEQQDSFERLKVALTTAPVLAHPDPTKPYLLYTDASDKCIGAILVQKDDQGVERVIHYLSHKLSGAQLAWPTIEKEAYAIVYALKKLHAYLWGASFEIHTDHKPLKSLFQAEIRNTKLQRWAIQISEYGAPILYHPGKLNVRADMLSRIAALSPPVIASLAPAAVDLPSVWDTDHIPIIGLQHGQRGEFEDAFVEASLDADDCPYVVEEGLLYTIAPPYKGAGRYPRLLLPQAYRGQVIDRCHGEIGHAGFSKTLLRVQEHYVWPGMRQHIREYLATCSRCRALTPPNQKDTIGKMPTPPAPFHTWGMDLVGPFPRDKTGKQYLLTAVDHLTGWAIAIPIASKKSATVWQAFNEHLVAVYGVPTVLITDNGGEFIHKAFEDWLREMGVEHHLTSPYNPQANGACERFNGTLQKLLLKLTGGDSRKWTHFLAEALYAYRIAPSVHGPSPYQAVFGQNPRLPRVQGGHSPHGERLEALHTSRKYLEKHREKVKARCTADTPSDPRYKPGDYVSLRVLSPTKGESKWAPGYQVIAEYQGGLRLIEIATGKVIRVNQRRVRLLPDQKAYDEIDPLPRARQKETRDLPRAAIPVPLEPNVHIPVAPAAAVQPPSPSLFDDTDWSAWLDYCHFITTSV